jgi:hypothetical protein
MLKYSIKAEEFYLRRQKATRYTEYQCFGGTCRLHLQGGTVSQTGSSSFCLALSFTLVSCLARYLTMKIVVTCLRNLTSVNFPWTPRCYGAEDRALHNRIPRQCSFVLPPEVRGREGIAKAKATGSWFYCERKWTDLGLMKPGVSSSSRTSQEIHYVSLIWGVCILLRVWYVMWVLIRLRNVTIVG